MFNKIRNARKRWFVVVAAVALLSIGLVGGSAFAAGASGNVVGQAWYGMTGADERHGGGKDNSNAVMARVAEIIGVEQTALEGAFKTARDEQSAASFNERIDALVASETLTADEGKAARDWFAARPATSGPIAMRLAGVTDAEKVNSWLSKMVDKEKLTQDEADAQSAWHADRPESLPAYGKRDHRRHGRDRDGDGHKHDDGDGAAG